MQLLNPTIDLVFKLLLTRNQELLRSMLEAILDEPITDFTIDSVFELRERNTHQPCGNELALHLLQLSEIPRQPALDRTSAEHRVQLWARFLTARTPGARALLALEDPIMANAIESLEQLSADPELVRLAEERELSRFFYELSLANAKQEGLLEGKQEGLLEGKLETLRLLLHSKFGAVPESVQARLQRATDAELLRWAKRVLHASSLEDVFGD